MEDDLSVFSLKNCGSKNQNDLLCNPVGSLVAPATFIYIHFHNFGFIVNRRALAEADHKESSAVLFEATCFVSARKTLQLARQLKDRAVEAQACYSLGNTYTLLQDYERAIDYHLKHLIIAQDLNDR